MRERTRDPLGLAALVAAVLLGAAPARAQGLPLEPMTIAHNVEREGTARYRDPPVNVEGRYV
ncbi:MAG: hypothetical protein JO040_07225, partial [Gemmatimonadetes bacterium]|nr:hypothetical protein [Gemmatimonadota bacterium]